MELKIEDWGVVNEKMAQKYTVSDPVTGFLVEVTDFGCTLVRVKVPDREGNVADVTFGHNDPDVYVHGGGGTYGAMVGRYANRIANGTFELDGETYTLFINNAGKHSLHGGEFPFHKKFWTFKGAQVMDTAVRLKFQYVSADMEEGYPGELTTDLTYLITPKSLGWIFEATTDKPTIVNLTNHNYWNMEGLEPLIDDQVLKVDSDQYMPADETGLCTGEILPVDGLGVDYRKGKSLAQSFEEFGDVDNNFFLNRTNDKTGPEDVVFAASLSSARTGRTMTIFTSEPCIQVYTGNFQEGLPHYGDGVAHKHNGICLETQHSPNAINLPDLAEGVILRPGQHYYHKTIHVFTTD